MIHCHRKRVQSRTIARKRSSDGRNYKLTTDQTNPGWKELTQFNGEGEWKLISEFSGYSEAPPVQLTPQVNQNIRLSLETIKLLFPQELSYISAQRFWFMEHAQEYLTLIDKNSLALWQMANISRLNLRDDGAPYEPKNEPSRFITLRTSTVKALFPEELDFIRRHKYEHQDLIGLVNNNSLTFYDLYRVCKLTKAGRLAL